MKFLKRPKITESRFRESIENFIELNEIKFALNGYESNLDYSVHTGSEVLSKTQHIVLRQISLVGIVEDNYAATHVPVRINFSNNQSDKVGSVSIYVRNWYRRIAEELYPMDPSANVVVEINDPSFKLSTQLIEEFKIAMPIRKFIKVSVILDQVNKLDSLKKIDKDNNLIMSIKSISMTNKIALPKTPFGFIKNWLE